MTPEAVIAARRKLGRLWGLPRELTRGELGCVLRLRGKNPSESIREMEEGRTRISGTMSLAIEAMLAGWLPADRDVNLARAALIETAIAKAWAEEKARRRQA